MTTCKFLTRHELTCGRRLTESLILRHIPLLVLAALVSACVSDPQYVRQGDAERSEMIEMPLYSFVAPDIAVFKDNPWKRFARADKADDVMITTGWSDESYAATVEVKKETRLNTIDDLRKTSSVDGVPFSGAMAVERKQAQLLCVRPVMAGEVKPYPEGSLFMHVMTCIDTKTHVYYELTMSEQKIDDRGKVVAPSPKLELATSQFFDSFSVK